MVREMMTARRGAWRHLFVPQRPFEQPMAAGVRTFGVLRDALIGPRPEAQLRLVGQADPRLGHEQYKSLLPLYSLRVAAGVFGAAEPVVPEGWIEVEGFGPLDERIFVAQVVGRSMEPTIHDGDYGVFRLRPEGSRNGRIVLVQYRGPVDPETGGASTVKRYRSEDYTPIVLTPESEVDVQVVAEWLGALGRT